MRKLLLCSVAGCAFTVVPTFAATVSNPTAGCSGNTAACDPGTGQNIVVPPGYTVSVFAKDLNFPTGIAFRRIRNGKDGDNDGDDKDGDDLTRPSSGFEVYVLESGHG